MNERFLASLGVEQTGQIKVGVVSMKDLLGGSMLTIDLCELLDTCDEKNDPLLLISPLN